MAKYRVLRGFSYLADEAEHLAAVAGELAYEAGHRTRVEAGQVVENLPPWVVTALTLRGHIVDADAPVEPSPAPPVEVLPPAVDPQPEPVVEPEPTPEPEPAAEAPAESAAETAPTPEPVIDYTTEQADLGEPAAPEATP